MDSLQVRSLVHDAIDGRRLLDHPFYRRWEAGTLAPAELAAYAGQYRHIEAALPGVLATVAAAMPDGGPRRMVEANLADELGTPAPHLELFDGFASAAGASPPCPPSPATSALIGTQLRAAAESAAAGLAALAAYETQAADIAATKASGLRHHYGIAEAGIRFWDVHASMEEDHADWSLRALAQLTDHRDDVTGSAGATAEAWWAFLDEREAAAR